MRVLFLPGSEVCQHHVLSSYRLPPTSFLLFPELFLIYLVRVLLRPGTSTSVFLDTDIILNNLSEHIKVNNRFHSHPLSSHSREVLSYLLMEMN